MADAHDAGHVTAVGLGVDELFSLSLDLLCVATVEGEFKQVNPAFERTLGYTAEELLRRPSFEFVHPDDLDRTRDAMEVLRRGQELHQFENRYVCRDGSIRWLQWNTRPGPSEGLVAAAARDVTDSRARKEQAALRHVATLVARRAPPTEVFTAVASEVASLLDADFSVIGRYEPDGSLTHVAASPLALVTALGPRMALDGDGLASVIRRSGQPARIAYDDAPGAIAALAREVGVRCGVGAPILVDDEVWGVMAAGWADPLEASSDTVARIADFAELVATAIANTESRAALIASRARVVTSADEARRRIERDLHDGVQQQLVTVALKLQSVASSLPTGSEELRADLSEVASGLDRVLDELREVSRGIHPAALATGGLGPAVKTLARRSLVPVDVSIRVPARPPAQIEVAVYYVVAEALTNVAKHGNASLVVVDVEARNKDVRVAVSDDGVGGADPSRGSGLVGLRDRVDALGGTMSLSSPAGNGTSLVVHLPVASE